MLINLISDVFKPDPDYLESEEKYKQIKKGNVAILCVEKLELLFCELCVPYTPMHLVVL